MARDKKDRQKDRQRKLEEESLLNVRALLNELEEEEKAAKRRQWIWLGLAGMIPVAFLVALFVNASLSKRQDANRERLACEAEQTSARVADFRRKMRESEPDAPPGRVEMLLRENRKDMETQAKTHCAGENK
ncbi:MAG: hypothetical protein ACM3X5_05410 [Bacillota bacterium]